MKLKNLYFIITCISIHNNHTQASYNPQWKKLALSTKAQATKKETDTSDSTIVPYGPEVDKPVQKVAKLPPVALFGFIAGDRDLYTKAGIDLFNQLIEEKILQNSDNLEKPFFEEMDNLQEAADNKIHKNLPKEVKAIQKAAKDKKLNWNPNHIFTPTIETHPQGYPALTGFHHDPSNTVERSGVFEFRNKKENKEGFYCASLAIDPSNPSSQFHKTFFPAHWTRKQVVDCILLSMKNIEAKPVIYNNGIATEYSFKTPIKYKDGAKITSLNTSLAIGFRVFNNSGITQMPTAYPDLPKS